MGITIFQIQSVTSQRENLFGTDFLGRDTFSRVLHGARISLRIAILATLFSCSVGVSIGIVSGYLPAKTASKLEPVEAFRHS